ncbi:MAG: nuclear transport factor 2 family protein [Actinomycetota bacterium]|nr:nuclear transport factor 2 family protein [Actinomycetota bacterium]
MDEHLPYEGEAIAAEQPIRDLLKEYERSLNASDAELAVACYTSDGVFMATTLPTASSEELNDADVRTFAAIRLDVQFTIDELFVASDDVAHALTRSAGTQTTLATGDMSGESNREIFVFRRQDRDWRFSRYLLKKPQ